jgi:Protein of unknown function (DUF4236)
MSWYIKKSFRFGPIRFNLSKSGIGVSGGVKGFRVGTGPRGPYVHAGRGGIYYRKSLKGTEGDSPGSSPEPAESTTGASPPKKRAAFWPVLVFLSVIVVLLLVWLGMSETIIGIAAAALFVICSVVAALECTRESPSNDPK